MHSTEEHQIAAEATKVARQARAWLRQGSWRRASLKQYFQEHHVEAVEAAASNMSEAAKELRKIGLEKERWEGRKQALRRDSAAARLDSVNAEVYLPDGVHSARLRVGRHCATEELCAMAIAASGDLLSSATRPGDCDLLMRGHSIGAAGLVGCDAEDEAVLVLTVDSESVQERKAHEADIRQQWDQWQGTVDRWVKGHISGGTHKRHAWSDHMHA